MATKKKKPILALPVRVSVVDRDGEYFPDGAEQFSLDINVPRGPVWDVLFDSFRTRKPVEIMLVPADATTKQSEDGGTP